MEEQDDLEQFELNQIFQDHEGEDPLCENIEISVDDEISLGGN